MQCSQCGQQESITIKGKTYCGNCGAEVGANVLNLDTQPQESQPKPASGNNVLDLSASDQTPGRPTPPGQPAGPLHSPTPAPEPKPKPEVKPKPEPEPEPAPPAPEGRLARLAHVKRSRHISKFGTHTPAFEEPAEEPTQEEVDQPPAPTPVPRPRPNVGDEIARRHVRTPQTDTLTTATAAPEEPVTSDEPTAEDTKQPRRSLAQLLFRRPKLTSASAAVISVLLLASYVTYLNLPNIALRVAASRAGFSARMPHYLPGDYDFEGPVAYGPGQIVVSFNSDDGGDIVLTQRATDMDSESLLENQILPETDKYLTFYEKGLTIYIYDGNSAAWVNRGIWYEISGNNLLNSEQVIRMATSL